MTSLLNDYIRAITETNRPSTESVDKPIEARCPLYQYQKPTDEAPTVGDMHDYALRQMKPSK